METSNINNLDKDSIHLDKNTCIKLLSKDVFESGRIEEAFGKQETDIAIFNTTHSQYGPLFASNARLTNNNNFGFETNIVTAIKNARNKKKMIVLCSESLFFNRPFEIYALVEEKEVVENYGSRLDKIEKDNKINTKTTEGYQKLISEAKALV